jgi:peptidoglycan/xylan/chitin deacetylase (PgdA/CDA1 family)
VKRLLHLVPSLALCAFDSVIGLFVRRTDFTVLVYHDVSDAEGERFGAHLRILEKRTVVRPEEIFAKEPVSGGVLITFDDALEGVYKNALPQLRKHGMHSVIFVPAQGMGDHPRWKQRSNVVSRQSRIATLETIRSNKDQFVSYGSHSWSHLSLKEANATEARREIIESKKELERALGFPIEYFAFPYGHYNTEHLELCREAGYRAVFAAKPEWNALPENRFLIPRVGINPSDSDLEVWLKARGAYRWLGMASAAKQWVKKIFSKAENTSGDAIKQTAVAQELKQ